MGGKANSLLFAFLQPCVILEKVSVMQDAEREQGEARMAATEAAAEAKARVDAEVDPFPFEFSCFHILLSAA